ncbi:hypothetical protein [uncultured Lacinutrix sp.]|uniref:hypothetical protein n=1 Tax=uncultured Lacinutrix sp. TaxID=574032 RepID=UPI002638C96B|nr:hypothetical protein [uncultured Lacinutrix sp.]
MKKTVFLLIATFGFLFTISAQEISKNAIGLRLGDGNGFGAEVSYQRAIKNNNRLEFDLGLRSGRNFNGVKLVGLYQWVWNIDGGFNWYAGAGAGAASFRYDDGYFRDDFRRDYTETFILATGDIGVEYNFEIPLLVSLDVRPEVSFGDSTYDLDFDVALSVRYQF